MSYKIPLAKPTFSSRERKYLLECIDSGWISSQGKFVNILEEKIAHFCKVKYAIATSNGTTALHLAIRILDIGPRDEVIVPTLTFIATANAVAYEGAIPRFIDSDLKSWTLSVERLYDALGFKTRAIIPVHLYGQAADMPMICKFAKKHRLKVIEDCAEALGASIEGKKVGTWGDVSILSFYGNKIITCGEGGMVLTNDPDYAQKARMLRDHGMDPQKKYYHPLIGYNYRMTNMQAAVGLGQLERISEISATRQEIGDYYDKKLKDIPGIILQKNLPQRKKVLWLYSILINKNKFGISRDELMEVLEKKGIESRPFFIPVHRQPPYYSSKTYKNAELLSAEGLNLPTYESLSQKEITYICNIIKDVCKC